MQEDEQRQFWIRRLEATGKAQARHLWVLLIAQLFYLALHASGANSHEITVPVIDLRLNALTVLASGAPVIAFLVLVVMGAIRAWTHAVEQVAGTSPVKDAEHLDAHPNAIDFAMYTTTRSPAVIKKILYFVYPLFLLIALVESAWLGAWLGRNPLVPWRVVFIGVLAVTWIPAAFLVLAMWLKRLRKLWQERSAV